MFWILQHALLWILGFVVIKESSSEQCLLSNMSWSDTMNKEYRLKVVTVATEKTDGFLRFMRSTKLYNLDVEVFGLDGKWQQEDILDEPGGGMKLDLLRKALEKYKNEKKMILMFVDSYETIFTAGKKEILKKFQRTAAQILISAEDYCWNDGSLKTRYLVRHGQGYRYLCSGGIIGHASAVYTILTLMTVKPKDHYQLYYRHIFLDDRKKYSIKWDRRSELFQNLNGYKENIELKFDGDDLRIINTGYKTVPVVIHGNGPSKLHLNHLANYAPKGWTHKDGCLACYEDTFDLMKLPRDRWPIILLGLFIRAPTPFLDSFFRQIFALDYPKDKMDVFLHNAEEHHTEHVAAWKKEFGGSYRSVYIEGPSSRLNDQQARNIGIHHCKKVKCDYYFSVDADVALTNKMSLIALIVQNRPFLAPMVTHIDSYWWPNFWGDLDEEGNYLRSEDYFSIANRTRRGVWNVPYVSDVYLIKSSVMKKISITPYHSKELDAYVAFCKHLRETGVFMYVTNMRYFGHLKVMHKVTTEHKHNDLYQIFDNVIDWEEKYLHDDFSIDVDPKVLKQPCHDVFMLPFASKRFTKEMIEEFEHLEQWYLDERITGGYENVATSRLSNIGFDKQWNSMLKQYFTPIAERLFPGYFPKNDAPTSIVVQYWATKEYPILFNDLSTYTIAIALNERGVHYQGGGEKYVRYNCDITDTKEGWAVIRPGRLTHQYQNIMTTRGHRYVLVSLVDP